jgi:hypothetical protein
MLYSAPMVRGLLNDTKNQTRRVVKQQIVQDDRFVGGFKLIGPGGVETAIDGPLASFQSPYGSPGDRLWVRETFCPIYPQDPTYNSGRPIEYDYAATYQHGNRLGDSLGVKKRWKPSIHMPRRASRITLEITGVRVERLQDISEADAIAEGVESFTYRGLTTYHNYALSDEWAEVSPMLESPIESYQTLWESINGPDSWAENPWVWVVEFKRVESGNK